MIVYKREAVSCSDRGIYDSYEMRIRDWIVWELGHEWNRMLALPSMKSGDTILEISPV